jgi:hypothetical protein
MNNSSGDQQQQDLDISTNNDTRKASPRCKIYLSDYLNPLYLILLSPILKSLQSDGSTSENEKLQKYHNIKYNNSTERILLNEKILASIIYSYRKFMEVLIYICIITSNIFIAGFLWKKFFET